MASKQQKSPIRVTREQFFRITEVLRGELREWLMEYRPGYTQVVEKVEKIVGHPVSSHTIEEANKMVQVWVPHIVEKARATFGNALQHAKAKMEDLEARLETLENEVEFFKRLVRHLYIQLGAQPPAGTPIPDAPTNGPVHRLHQVQP